MTEPEQPYVAEQPFVSAAHRDGSRRRAFAWGFVAGACAGWLIVVTATLLGRLP